MDNNKALERAEIIAALRSTADGGWVLTGKAAGVIIRPEWLRAAADLLERDAEPNDPLTLEELRWMDGEPVWVEFIGKPDGSLIPPLWMFVNVGRRQLVTDVEYVDWSDEGWTAYRRKPEGGRP